MPHFDRKICNSTIAALLCMSVAAKAKAEPEQEQPDCTGERGLNLVACELSAVAQHAKPGSPISYAWHTESERVARPNDLAKRIAMLIAGRTPQVRFTLPVTKEPKGQTKSSKRHARRTRLRLSLRLRAARLQVTAQLLRDRRTVWARIRGAQALPSQHGFAETALDAEIRSFLPIIPIAPQTKSKHRLPMRDVLALHCSMATPGRNSLLLIGRQSLALGRLTAEGWQSNATQKWATLTPVAPHPLRTPLASAAVHSGVLTVGSSDRAHRVLLSDKLRLLGKKSRALPWPNKQCSAFAIAGTAAPGSCRNSPRVQGSHRFDAFTSTGTKSWAGRQGRTGITRWELDGKVTELRALGAQLHLVDLDGDGTPELLASAAVSKAKNDSLSIFQWGKRKAIHSIPITEGISAISSCPREQSNRLPPLFVATLAGQLWQLA